MAVFRESVKDREVLDLDSFEREDVKIGEP